MTQSTDIKIQDIVAAFAAKHVAFRQDLQAGHEFPHDIWQKMGETGLFKISIPEIYGGTGDGYLALLQAGEAFVKSGYNLGLAVSWLYQQIIAHYVIGAHATSEQHRQYLPAAAEGKIILSFAVSEPGHGAHPKMLRTSAQQHNTSYILNGEKTYLTNGPIADIFIVVAVTDDVAAKKRFTAFIVPRTTAGLTVTPPLTMNFLKPSPHGGIKLVDCVIGEKSVLGRVGATWQDIVVPLGEIEDVVMMGPVLGGMAAQLAVLVDAIRENPTAADRTLQEELGTCSALLQTLRVIAYEAAARQDLGNASPIPLMITFSRIAAECLAAIDKIQDTWKIPTSAKYDYLQRDLASLMNLKKRLMPIRQGKIGAALLKT